MLLAEITDQKLEEYWAYIINKANIQGIIVFELFIGRRFRIRLNSQRESKSKQSSV